MERIKKYIKDLDIIIGSATIIAMVSVVIIQVIYRYLNKPLSWPEESARWMMIWITFVGASYSFKNGGLIRVDFFVKRLFPPRVQRYIDIFAMGMIALFFSLLGYSSIQYMLMSLRRSQVYPVTKLPVSIIILSVLIGSIMLVGFSIKEAMCLINPELDSCQRKEV